MCRVCLQGWPFGRPATMGFRDLAKTVYFSIHGYVVQRKINAQEQVLPPYCKEHVLPLHCKVSRFQFNYIDMTL